MSLSGVFGKIFGTKKAVESIVDKDDGLLVQAGSFFGNLHYSDQEKANDNKDVREWGIRQLDALAPFKVVQRILAFAVAFMWITVGLNVLIMIWINHANLSLMMEFAFSDYVWWPTAMVFALYFAGGAINSIKGSK